MRPLAPRRAGRLRVAYIDHCARLSGGQLALIRLLGELPDVERVAILAEDGPLVPRLEEVGVRVQILAMDESARGLPLGRIRPGSLPLTALWASGRYTLRLVRTLRQVRPDLVHTNSLKAALYGGIAGRCVPAPVIWHLRDRIAEDYMPLAAVRLVRALARVLPSAVIANSSVSLATLQTARVPSYVIPSLVRLEEFRDHQRRPGRSGRPLTVGMLGRIAPWKGQHHFLRAFAQAFAGGDVKAVIVGAPLFGEDEYCRGLRDLARTLGIAKRVTFAGFREDVANVLADWDVLVHASVMPEPFGQVVVEGMAAGLAVVASGAGGPLEHIEHEVNGLLYEPGDIENLAGSLRRVVADAELRERLGSNAQRAVERFGPDVISGKVMDAYLDVLALSRRKLTTFR